MDNEISYEHLKDMVYTLQVISEQELDKIVDGLNCKEKDFLLRLLIQKIRGNLK